MQVCKFNQKIVPLHFACGGGWLVGIYFFHILLFLIFLSFFYFFENQFVGTDHGMTRFWKVTSKNG